MATLRTQSSGGLQKSWFKIGTPDLLSNLSSPETSMNHINLADQQTNDTIERQFAQSSINNSQSKEYMTYSKGPHNDHVKVLVSGSIAGAISRSATAGFERLTIIQQVQGMTPNAVRYVGCVSALREMVRKEGFLSLFRGNGANVLKVSPNSAIRFFTYEICKNKFTGNNSAQRLSGSQTMVAGAMAGFTSTLCTYPLDVIRTRLSLQGSSTDTCYGALRYKGVVHCLQKTFAEEGVRGLYKGLGTAVVSVAPWVSLSFASYEGLKTLASRHNGTQIIDTNNDDSKLNFNNNKLTSTIDTTTSSHSSNNKGKDMLTDFLCGAASGGITMTVCYPLDVLRRRMMIQGIGGQPTLYKNGVHALKTIVNTEGAAALYRGITPAYFKVVPTVAITFAVYEMCKEMMG
eukprot:gene16692-19843_t